MSNVNWGQAFANATALMVIGTGTSLVLGLIVGGIALAVAAND